MNPPINSKPPFSFGYGSLKQRDTLHPDLVKVFDEVIKESNITLLQGYRDKQGQDKVFAEGKSKLQWPKSRHNTFPSEAVDVVPYPVNWKDIGSFKKLAVIVKDCAERVGVEIEWGGDWKTWKDYPHWQLKKTAE